VAGLRRALQARDTELGLGAGGAVAEAIRRSAYDLAPLDSEATVSVDLSAAGSISAIAIDDATSRTNEWERAMRDVHQRLGDRFVAAGGAQRVTLLVRSRSRTRAGSSATMNSFDVSNIGSPSMQSLHIEVLRQMRL
jgi:hypothetical protein